MTDTDRVRLAIEKARNDPYGTFGNTCPQVIATLDVIEAAVEFHCNLNESVYTQNCRVCIAAAAWADAVLQGTEK